MLYPLMTPILKTKGDHRIGLQTSFCYNLLSFAPFAVNFAPQRPLRSPRFSPDEAVLRRTDLRRSSEAGSCSPVPTTCRRRKLVDPLLLRVPATTAITSPGCTACSLSNNRSAFITISSAFLAIWQVKGCTPHIRLSRAHTVGPPANAKTWALGRYLEINRAVVP